MKIVSLVVFQVTVCVVLLVVVTHLSLSSRDLRVAFCTVGLVVSGTEDLASLSVEHGEGSLAHVTHEALGVELAFFPVDELNAWRDPFLANNTMPHKLFLLWLYLGFHYLWRYLLGLHLLWSDFFRFWFWLVYENLIL